MKVRYIIVIGFTILLTACLNSKYPIKIKEFEGVVMACKADSNTIINDTIIKVKRSIQSPKIPCINCKYLDCINKPEYFDFVIHWPGSFTFDFKKGQYFFLNNASPQFPNIKLGEKGYAIRYDLDYGEIKINRKAMIMTLISSKYNITRSFIYCYSNQDSILILKKQK